MDELKVELLQCFRKTTELDMSMVRVSVVHGLQWMEYEVYLSNMPHNHDSVEIALTVLHDVQHVWEGTISHVIMKSSHWLYSRSLMIEL